LDFNGKNAAMTFHKRLIHILFMPLTQWYMLTLCIT